MESFSDVSVKPSRDNVFGAAPGCLENLLENQIKSNFAKRNTLALGFTILAIKPLLMY